MTVPPLAHGGVLGAIAEATVALTVVLFFVAIWLRERSARRRRDEVDVRDEAD
jgi:hypothetical protein